MENAKFNPIFNNSLSAWDIVGCPSGVYHKKIGTTKPFLHPELVKIKENFTRAAEMGKSIQREIRLKWARAKILIAEEKKIENDWNLWLKFDAICRAKGRIVLLEIKSVSESFFQRIRETKKPRGDNRIQSILYHNFLKNKYKNLEVAVFYVNRKNQLETITIPINYSETEIQELYKKVCDLNRCIDSKKQPEPVKNIIYDDFTKEYIVNPSALMCDYIPSAPEIIIGILMLPKNVIN